MCENAQRERSDTHDPRRGCTKQVVTCAKTHSGSAPTRTIPAEGAQAQIHMRKNAQRERSDTHDPRRGCAATNPHAQKRTAGALRHARSPQRVRGDKSKCAKTHSGSAPTRTIPAEGARRQIKMRKNAQRERPDTHDPRRGVHRASRGETHPSLRNKREFNRGGDVMVVWSVVIGVW